MQLIKKPWEYTFTKETSGYLLSVVCGSVGLYEVEVTLNEEQLSKYNATGEAYLDELASQIRKNPERFI